MRIHSKNEQTELTIFRMSSLKFSITEKEKKDYLCLYQACVRQIDVDKMNSEIMMPLFLYISVFSLPKWPVFHKVDSLVALSVF